MSLSISPFIMPYTFTRGPTPDAVKQLQTIIEAPPCLTVFFVYLGSNCLLGGRRTYGLPSLPKTLNLDSSLQTIMFEKLGPF